MQSNVMYYVTVALTIQTNHSCFKTIFEHLAGSLSSLGCTWKLPHHFIFAYFILHYFAASETSYARADVCLTTV